jgi:hypothetical protein
MRGDMTTESATPPAAPLVASGDALGDDSIANNLRQQAMRMSAEAKGLLAEADRLLQEANGMDPKAIQQVELLSCEVYLEDGNNFDDVEGVTFQLSSKNANMQQLAIAENKEKGKKSLKLDIAKKNDAADHFNSDKVIAVVEVNAAEGGDTEYKFKAKVKFRFTSKQTGSK